MNIQKFKPNLIINNKEGEVSVERAIENNGGCSQYLITLKKDGCRMLVIDGEVRSRSMKTIKSIRINEMFAKLALEMKAQGVILDGEIYSHGMSFTDVYRFFSTSDVTDPKKAKSLVNLKKNNPTKYQATYGDRSIEFLTKFPTSLKFWIFDGVVINQPELTYSQRMQKINFMMRHLMMKDESLKDIVELPEMFSAHSFEQVTNLFNRSVEKGWEGLVLTHKNHVYETRRTPKSAGTLLKMKDNENIWDGVILDVQEGEKIKEGVARTTNELGRSVTSKKKEDREPSGLAKGFLVQFEDKGTFTVPLKGFDNEAKRELLTNKELYIGRTFSYKGMPPTKDFPRSVSFLHWRDEK